MNKQKLVRKPISQKSSRDDLNLASSSSITKKLAGSAKGARIPAESVTTSGKKKLPRDPSSRKEIKQKNIRKENKTELLHLNQESVDGAGQNSQAAQNENQDAERPCDEPAAEDSAESRSAANQIKAATPSPMLSISNSSNGDGVTATPMHIQRELDPDEVTDSQNNRNTPSIMTNIESVTNDDAKPITSRDLQDIQDNLRHRQQLKLYLPKEPPLTPGLEQLEHDQNDAQTSPMAKHEPTEKKNGFEINLMQVQSEDVNEDQGSSQEEAKDLSEADTTQNLDNTRDRAIAISKSQAPMPILPKPKIIFKDPIKCPLDHIKFIELKKHAHFEKQKPDDMLDGYDLVGNRRKMIQLRTEAKLAQKEQQQQQPQIQPVKKETTEAVFKMDESTRFIHNTVYARDTSIIEPESGMIPQRAAFNHINELDVKRMVKEREMRANPEFPGRATTRRYRQEYEALPDSQLHTVTGPEDTTLIFESKFESGNLYLAQKVSENEYNLLMQNDINTSGHTQWFYFRVANTRAKSTIKFNILNYNKPDSLFNYGMKVSVYSEKMAANSNIGWHRDGNNISYIQNNIRKDINYSSKCYYTATWTYKFQYDFDQVYFAYSIPFTYSDLTNQLENIEADDQRSQFFTKRSLCTTLGGVSCDVLTITSRDNLEDFGKRKGIIITGRVHPGETVGSHMMSGVIQFLTDPINPEAKLLRENFVFKVIPMLNPDGVINGNYRCSLAGCDLNRRWKNPSKMLHPTIYHTKKLVQQVHEERGLVMFCDLHGHSRKQNVFMYGCNYKNQPGETRVFPFILSKLNPYFHFASSKFGVQKSKESTARVALFKQLKSVPNIFTMESSFAGVDQGKLKGKHFTVPMLMSLGEDLCRAILAFSNILVQEELQELPFFKRKKDQALTKDGFEEDNLIKEAIMQEFNDNKDLLEAGDGDSSEGSDSAPSDDNLPAEQIVKNLPIIDKNLKVQLKKEQQRRDKEKADLEKLQVTRRVNSIKKPQQLLQRVDSPKKLLVVKPVSVQSPQQKQDEEEVKKEEKPKKPKVETRDAATQTEQSSVQQIKEQQARKLLKRQMLRQQQEIFKASQEQLMKRNTVMEMPQTQAPVTDRGRVQLQMQKNLGQIGHMPGTVSPVKIHKHPPPQLPSSRLKRESTLKNNHNCDPIVEPVQQSRPKLSMAIHQESKSNPLEKATASSKPPLEKSSHSTHSKQSFSKMVIPSKTNLELSAKDQQMIRLAQTNCNPKFAFVGISASGATSDTARKGFQKPLSHEARSQNNHESKLFPRDSQLNSFSHHEQKNNQQSMLGSKSKTDSMPEDREIERIVEQTAMQFNISGQTSPYKYQSQGKNPRDEQSLQINVMNNLNPIQQYYSQTMSRNKVKPQLLEGLAHASASQVRRQNAQPSASTLEEAEKLAARRGSHNGSVFNTDRKIRDNVNEFERSPQRRSLLQTVGDHAAVFLPSQHTQESVTPTPKKTVLSNKGPKSGAQNYITTGSKHQIGSNVLGANDRGSNYQKLPMETASSLRFTGQSITTNNSAGVSKEMTKLPQLTIMSTPDSLLQTTRQNKVYQITSPSNENKVLMMPQQTPTYVAAQLRSQFDGGSSQLGNKRASGDLVTAGYYQKMMQSPNSLQRGSKNSKKASQIEQKMISPLFTNELVIKEALQLEEKDIMSPTQLRRNDQHLNGGQIRPRKKPPSDKDPGLGKYARTVNQSGRSSQHSKLPDSNSVMQSWQPVLDKQLHEPSSYNL